MTYHMPAAMGGGKEKGLALFRTAMEKYAQFRPKSVDYPNWGKEDVEKYLRGEGK